MAGHAPPRRGTFHRLPVVEWERLTEDALAVTFAVPEPLRETYAFHPGQHVTVRVWVDGEQARRSYSICSTPSELAAGGRFRIGIKEIPGGVFSRYAAHQLVVGDTVEVQPPLGHFFTRMDPAAGPRWYAAVAAGSGITPVLSLLATALAVEPASRFTLFYGNRYARSVMFAEELADLKDRWPDRLHVVHVLSREPGPAELLSGRLDADRLSRLLDTFLPRPVDEWFLCGPYRLVQAAQEVLVSRGTPERAVHTELFYAPEPDPVPPPGPGSGPGTGTASLTVRLDGRTSQVEMEPGERVLDAALRVRSELPYACRGGVCSTCRARVVSGAVEMVRNWALQPEELAAGYVLTCQSRPITEQLTVDYDG